jgi:inorganic pyrophosphatase/exopolyphosphatase
VYSVLNRPQSALYHAERCLDICKEHNIGDFDIAFAYEAMARAHAVAGDKSDCEKYIKLAKEAGEQIKKKEDKDLFFNDLKTVPGYN